MATLDLKSIHYMDEPADDYCKGLDKASSWDELRQHIEMYAPLFPDAYEAAREHMPSYADFDHFKLGLKMERKGKFSGEDWMTKFGAILMPANMIHLGEIAIKYGVPTGLAFCRLVESGIITIKNNGVEWHR